jgi:2'-5' RNA ligase
MRLFVAIEVPDAWREAARDAGEQLVRTSGVALRLVDPALLHLTLRFLGEVPDDRLPALDSALAKYVPPIDIELTLGTAGTFGSPARTSVAWLGIGGDLDALLALVARGDGAIREAGLSADQERFSPHLTLARVGRAARPAERRALVEAARALPAPSADPFRVRELVLVRSYLGGRQPRYEVIGRYG